MTRTATVIALGIALAGCDDSSGRPLPPAAPTVLTPAPQPQPPAQPVVSGIVYDHDVQGRRPLASFGFTALVGTIPDLERRHVETDAAGRFSVEVIAGGWFLVDITDDGFHAPCPAGKDGVVASTRVDIDVVSAGVLTAGGAPSSLPRDPGLSVEGTVQDVTDGAFFKPVAGALIRLGEPPFESTTLTNRSGGYFVCTNPPSTGTDTYATIRASKSGFRPASLEVFLGWFYRGDFRLVRE